MDSKYFDRFVQELLGSASRRRLLQRLCALLLAGGVAFVPEPAENSAATRRRNRRQARHRHRPGDKRRKRHTNKTQQKTRCPSDAQVCASGCPFTSIQAAIDAAESGATIRICAGTFTEAITIAKDVKLIGVGSGIDPIANTIVKRRGDRSVVVISAGSVELQSLRITDGRSPNHGGGIKAVGATRLTVTDCTIIGNKAWYGIGGGIYKEGGDLTLTNCTITNNEAYPAGGIRVIGGSNHFIDTSFTKNRGGFGSGVSVELNTEVTFSGCLIANNELSPGLTNQGTVYLYDTVVTGNTSLYSGAGINNRPTGVLTIDPSSSVTSNRCTGHPDYCDGGGVANLGTISCSTRNAVRRNDPDDCVDLDGGTGCDSCNP